jgi:hypothetical protein
MNPPCEQQQVGSELMMSNALAALRNPQAARGLLRLDLHFLQGTAKAVAVLDCAQLEDAELSSYAEQQGTHKLVETLTAATSEVGLSRGLIFLFLGAYPSFFGLPACST